MEDIAQLKRKGVWSKTNPNKLLQLREKQWNEDRRLATIQKQGKAAEFSNRVNINKAKLKELISIDGIGPSLAKRIIKGRPYVSIKDLLKISGIGKKKLKAIRSKIRLVP